MSSDPEVFGGFLLVRRLAESAMAGVFLAVRLGDSSGKPIVIKRPPLGERASGRAAQAILREAEVLESVRGAGLPALEAAGDIAGLPYVAIERLRGATLAKLLSLGEALPSSAVRAIGRDVGRALGKLHAAGWVHRDVTPSNLFVDDAGEVYLLDFGLCARAGDEREALVAGTRGYAAPESATARAASPAQDVYGLAVCLAEAALGRRLFNETSLVEAGGRGDAPPEAAALEASIPGLTASLRRDPSARPKALDLASMLAEMPASPGDPNGGAALAEAAERAQRPLDEALPSAVPAVSSAIASVERMPSPSPSPVAAFGPPPSVTPTISMPILTVREIPTREAIVMPTMRDAREPRDERRAPARRGTSLGLVLVVAFGAIVIGFVSGRFSMRGARGSSFAVEGALPKRAELFLDNKKLTIADGVPLPVPAGTHTLVIVTPKNGKRDVPFSVRPGEHVVILTGARGAAAPEEEAPP